MKWLVVLMVIVAVCYPYPGYLARHLRHWRNPDELIDPDAAVLADWHAELAPQLAAIPNDADKLPAVESFVRAKVPYAFDWDTWGVVDYLPTVEEVARAGREDCDGRAVVAASLLRAAGVEARLVADGAHVWVWTPHGETMGPNPVATVTVKDDGFAFNLSGLRVLPRGMAYGIAVFPWPREAIVVVVIWLLLLRPGLSARRALIMAALLATALVLIRLGGAPWRQQQPLMIIAGVIACATAILLSRTRPGPVASLPGESQPPGPPDSQLAP